MGHADEVVPGAARVSVLHLSTERGLRGGERQVALLAAGLAASVAAQAVAAPAGARLLERAREMRLSTLDLPGLRGPRSLVRLRRWLRVHPGAIVHAHTSPALDVARLLRVLAPIAGVVYTRRTVFPVRPAGKYRRGADRVVAVAEAVATELLRAGVARERVRVIPSAVDLAEVDSASPVSTSLLPGGRPLAACVAALALEKGHDLLLDAWARVLADHPRACLLLIGDGPERRRVSAAVSRLPEGSVRLLGDREDVPRWLKSVDLAVLASSSEGVGGALLEAMACSRAVVATAVGGLPETVADGVTGILVPPGDPAALADALTRLLADRELRWRLGCAGRRRVEDRFSRPAAAAAHLELYRELLPAAGAT